MRRTDGFTLIEVLVVIAIIGILAGLLIPTISNARQRGVITATHATIQTLRQGLESYQVRFGDYPPTSLKQLGITVPNDTNQGIESLVACMSTTRSGGPFVQLPEEQYGNTDSDTLARNPTAWWFGDAKLREILDGWGRPLVYFHNRDYVKCASFGRYAVDEGIQIVAPQKSAATGTYHNPLSYQIWSFGPDGVNQNGGEDDIAGW